MSAFLDKHRCPITHEIMSDPVLAPDTHNYEREAITRALRANPVSPMTRQPIRVEQLIENRELRHEIESMIAAQESMTMEVEQMIPDYAVSPPDASVRRRDSLLQVSVTVQDGEAPPMSLAFVKDVSGSMNREVKTSTGETDGYNMLDIACHGTNVCLNGLRPEDKAMVITFNGGAKTLCPLRKMTPGNKGVTKVKMAGLSPGGCTNLWDGIKTALDALPDDGIVCVLTDGEPTVSPPKGELRMFKEWKDARPNWHGQIHTFGFGYGLDSKLLTEIAREGNGRYSFIPDSSLVGTIFVHAMANIRTTYRSSCVMSVETDGEITGIGPHTKTSWGYQIPIGPFMYGQTRDYFFHCSEQVRCSIDGDKIQPLDTEPDSDERQRIALCMMQSLVERPDIQRLTSTVTHAGLLEDMNGQWREALQSEYFRRWGRHYIPSLAGAHFFQICNNFLDKGIQQYGGGRFQALRDKFDELFNGMSAPRATLRVEVQRRMASRGESMRAAPSTMASYNRCDGPCFPGWSRVKMENGTTKILANVRRGDRLLAPGGIATVEFVLKTMCPRGSAKLVQIGTLMATPWHPIRKDNRWVFPSSLADAEDVPCEAIYSLKLDTVSCYIDDVECIGLGHGIENDEVASHYFFGTDAVTNMLLLAPTSEDGLVQLSGPEAIQRDDKGLVCGFIF